MKLLIAVFIGGALLMMALAEEPELDEKRRINRMAERSRRGRPAAVRQRCRYSKAGLGSRE